MRQGLRRSVCAAVSVVSVAGGLVAMSMAGAQSGIPSGSEQVYAESMVPPTTIAIGSSYAVETAQRINFSCAGSISRVVVPVCDRYGHGVGVAGQRACRIPKRCLRLRGHTNSADHTYIDSEYFVSPQFTTTPTATTTSTVPAGGVPVVYEAEAAVHNLVVETTEGGLGGGSLGYWDTTGGYVQFTINVTTAGVQTLDFRYAGITAATGTLIIDGTTATSVAFPATATFWSQWASKIVTTGSLSVGSHTVKLIRNASDVEMINLDRLTVTPPTTGATTTTTVPAGSGVVVSEAEDAVNNLTFDTTTGALGSFGRDR